MRGPARVTRISRDHGKTCGMSGHGKAVSFRPDIEGLRAIAVLAVMAFHFGVFHVTGGFVGVDAFFVISGYLITGILLGDWRKPGT